MGQVQIKPKPRRVNTNLEALYLASRTHMESSDFTGIAQLLPSHSVYSICISPELDSLCACTFLLCSGNVIILGPPAVFRVSFSALWGLLAGTLLYFTFPAQVALWDGGRRCCDPESHNFHFGKTTWTNTAKVNAASVGESPPFLDHSWICFCHPSETRPRRLLPMSRESLQ